MRTVGDLLREGGAEITAFYGITSDGKMLLASGEMMYSLSLPQ